jgi:hypothetical protein
VHRYNAAGEHHMPKQTQAITLPNRMVICTTAARLFPQEDLDSVMAMLDHYGIEPHEPDREGVQLAILQLSDGDADKLLHYIQAAKQDYRNVVYWAAYPHHDKKEMTPGDSFPPFNQ